MEGKEMHKSLRITLSLKKMQISMYLFVKLNMNIVKEHEC